MTKLTKAQRDFLDGCREFERGSNPRGLPSSCADRRVMPSLMRRNLIGWNIYSGEYFLSPAGRAALSQDKEGTR